MYSHFTILVEGTDVYLADVVNKLNSLIGYNCFVHRDKRITAEDEIKWYDYFDHMVELSKMFPNVLFKLFREYEEGDYMNSMGELKTTHTYIEFINGKDIQYNLSIEKTLKGGKETNGKI